MYILLQYVSVENLQTMNEV